MLPTTQRLLTHSNNTQTLSKCIKQSLHSISTTKQTIINSNNNQNVSRENKNKNYSTINSNNNQNDKTIAVYNHIHNSNNNNAIFNPSMVMKRGFHTTNATNKKLKAKPIQALLDYRVPTSPVDLKEVEFTFPSETATENEMLEIATFLFHDRIADYIEEATRKVPEKVYIYIYIYAYDMT